MPRQSPASARWPLLLGLAVYAPLAVAVAVHCADLLTSDGQCYLRMATYYARGDFERAVFGHWSPLGAWLTTPLVMARVLPRYAFRLLILTWGALAVWGTCRLAARVGLGTWLRAAVAVCAALLCAELSADHRVDLLLTALLLLYLDTALDPRLMRSRPWALGTGALGAAAYLAKLYALPFFLVHTPAVLLLRRRDTPGASWRQVIRAGGLALGGFALVALPWAGALSLKLGHFTFGTAAATSYKLVGPGSGDARREAVTGLRRPPQDAYNVWQDATRDAARPDGETPSPLSSGGAFRRAVERAVRNGVRILGHLAALDAAHLGVAALALLVLGALLRRPGEGRFLDAALAVTVLFYCGGYAFIQAENERYFWFPFLVLLVAVFRMAAMVAAWMARRRGGTLLALVVSLVTLSFAARPVRFLWTLLGQPPLGRQHRIVAEELAERGVQGPLAAAGEDRAWWHGLHTAYYLDAKYAGTPRARRPAEIAQEMQEATARTLLVWGDAGLTRALRAAPAFSFAGRITTNPPQAVRADVAVFRLRPPSAEEAP
jgi:hypothetical protein